MSRRVATAAALVLGLGLATAPARLLGREGAAASPIPLAEPSGQTLLMSSGARADYGTLGQVFLTQANLAYCGVASAVMVLNSLVVPAPAVPGYGPYRFWTQENIFATADARTVIAPETVARQGMTLQELAGLLRSHGVTAQAIHGDRLDLARFRALLRRSLADPGDRMLVNYHRAAVGQEGGGHISPLAAYHEASDRALILDVARYRYPAVWVELPRLWEAIRSLDSTSGRSRGLVVISRGETPRPAPPRASVRSGR
jgi:hypothetical protein